MPTSPRCTSRRTRYGLLALAPVTALVLAASCGNDGQSQTGTESDPAGTTFSTVAEWGDEHRESRAPLPAPEWGDEHRQPTGLAR
jgi:hypothetical protein